MLAARGATKLSFGCAYALLIIVLVGGCAAHAGNDEPEEVGGCSPSCYGLPRDARIISFHTLVNSLPARPIAVGFDIDDTVLFASGGFQYGTKKYGARIVAARESELT